MEADTTGSAGIEATCPWCGRVSLEAGLIRCELDPSSPSEGLCEFVCPWCRRLVLNRADAVGVDVLRLYGAKTISGPVPFELLERHLGAPLSWDEVLDARAAIEGTCCPQDDLMDSYS